MSEIVFVFVGSKLPSYALPSIRFTIKHSKVKVTLISEPDKRADDIIGLNKINLLEVYEGNYNFFNSNRINRFRNGFWNKTIERYIVLNNYMRKFKIKTIFHAELDNIIFDIRGLDAKLNAKGYGMHYPIVNENIGKGSFIYINDMHILEKFNILLLKSINFNDMQLLANFYLENRDKVFPLNIKPDKNDNVLESEIFDSAGYGQYLFGVDQRNTCFTVKNLYINPNENFIKFDGYKYHFNEQESKFYLENAYSKKKTNLINLHIHSKIHQKISYDYINFILKNANNHRKKIITFSWFGIPRCMYSKLISFIIKFIKKINEGRKKNEKY